MDQIKGTIIYLLWHLFVPMIFGVKNLKSWTVLNTLIRWQSLSTTFPFDHLANPWVNTPLNLNELPNNTPVEANGWHREKATTLINDNRPQRNPNISCQTFAKHSRSKELAFQYPYYEVNQCKFEQIALNTSTSKFFHKLNYKQCMKHVYCFVLPPQEQHGK